MTSTTMSSRRSREGDCGRPLRVWRTCGWHACGRPACARISSRHYRVIDTSSIHSSRAVSAARGQLVRAEAGAMLEVALLLVRCYRDRAVALAQRRQIAYPAELERVILARLEESCESAGATRWATRRSHVARR
jgi:hypothetical protein